MTLTPLKSKNNTRFLTNFLISLKSSRKTITFISFLQLFSLPLFSVIMLIYAANEGENYEKTTPFLLISVFCFLAAVFCGIFVAVQNFGYLYKKSQVDMVYSLPIKRTTKFLSDFLAGLAIYTVPYIIGCIVAGAIFALGGLGIDIVEQIFEETQGLWGFIIQGEFAVLLIMAMLYTLTVLVLCCCGSFFESILNIFMINGIIPGGIAVITSMFFSGLYGVSGMESVIPALGYTSPVGAMIYIIYTLDDYFYYSSEKLTVDAAIYAKWVIFFMLFMLLYFALSMFLYRRRKAEDVSKPYVFKVLYYVLVTVVVMSISLIARADEDNLLAVIIFSLIVYMIFEVITNRGFRKLYISLLKYAATMAGILLICVISDKTGGFGAEGKIYSVSQIKSVEVNYYGIDTYSKERDYHIYERDLVEFKNSDAIKLVTEVQKQAIDTYRSGKYETEIIGGSMTYTPYYLSDEYEEGQDYPKYVVRFRFNLKRGGLAVREYFLTREQLEELYPLETTEEFAEHKAEKVMECITFRQYRNKYEYSVWLSEETGNYEIDITEEQAKELKKLIKRDYMDNSAEEQLESETVYYISGIPVRKCYTATVEFLDNLKNEYVDKLS